jgi:hypothetical protein
MHGGRWAIAGFLYQILGSLGYVGHVAVTDANYRHDKLLRLQLRLEPQDGGDLTTESSDGRIVEQFKLRGSGRAWSASEIIDEVFPDLLRNVFTSTHIIGTRYRFTTNGRVVAQPLRDLLAEIGRIGPDANPLSVLDNNNATFLFRREYLTARSFFTKIMQASGCYDGDAKRLWNFLYRFEINDLISEQDYLDNIDELLSRLVEDEPIESTRDTLIGQLLRRAKAGATVTPAEILSTANLNWNILEKRNQIRARLREQTNRMIASEQYDRSLDARASAPPLTENWFTVLTGESGQGKTWQLLRLAHDYIEQHKSCVFLRDIQNIENLD